MAQPPGSAFRSNFFILLFSLLSFLQTSVPALPALPKGSPAPGSRESLFFLTVPWANIWFAFPHFLLCLPLPLPGPSFHLPPFSGTVSPCPPAPPLPPALAQRQWLGSRGWEEEGCRAQMYSQGAQQGNPAKPAQALIVFLDPPTHISPKNFPLGALARLDQVRVGGAGESPALLFGAFQGREKRAQPHPLQ